MLKKRKIKQADYDEKSKPTTSKYSLKRKQGVERNHKRHTIPVPWCTLCEK